jgi:hypothetical protein
MNTLSYVCLGILGIAMSVIYTIFNKKVGWAGIVVRGLTILSLLVFSLVCASLKSINNAFPLCISLGLAVLILSEVTFASNEVPEKAKTIVYGLFFAVTNLLFALSVLSLAEFNVFALLGGVLLGAGAGLIVCAVKKEKALYPVLMYILTYLSIGLLLGFGIMSITSSTHIASASMIFIAGILMLASKLLSAFVQNKKGMSYVISGLFILAVLLISVSIYCY